MSNSVKYCSQLDLKKPFLTIAWLSGSQALAAQAWSEWTSSCFIFLPPNGTYLYAKVGALSPSITEKVDFKAGMQLFCSSSFKLRCQWLTKTFFIHVDFYFSQSNVSSVWTLIHFTSLNLMFPRLSRIITDIMIFASGVSLGDTGLLSWAQEGEKLNCYILVRVFSFI